MKFLSLVLTLCLAASALHAAPEGQHTYPPEVSKAINEAAAAYTARDFKTALAKLDEVEKLTPNQPELLNLRGAIYTEQKHYDEGAKYFKKALAIDPTLFPSQFNIAEIQFLQRHYADARKKFETLQKEAPAREPELLQFKIFLTYLMEKSDAKATEILDAMKFPSDTPAYYFAHAAWSFAHDQPQDAADWMASSLRVFKPQQNLLYATTMYDLGWLKTRPVITPAGP